MGRSGRVAWLGRSTLAIVLAGAGLLVPAAAPAVRAADGLDIKADATYRVDIDDARVRVRIDVVITNRTPNRTTATGTIQYYYDRLYLPMQLDARNVRATSGGSTLGTSVARRDGYREVTIRFPNLFYARSRTIRLAYDLIAGKPRSDSDIRVGPAFTTFTAWAVGDDGKGTVRIVLPAGFDDDGYGSESTRTEDDGRWIIRSGTIADPDRWYRVVVAERPEALTDLTIGSAQEPIVIHAWPDDTQWRDTVAGVLEDGVPVLQKLIDLPWPVTGDLDVYQVHTPLLEGYGGFYDASEAEIRISEDLDPQLILHEASHAWFAEALIDERWIYEGLAETYSARAFIALDRDEPDPAPEAVTPDDPAAFPLSAWPKPERIDDEEIAAREAYGYDAAWTVMQAIVDEVGVEGMQAVLQTLDDRTSAYRQEGRTVRDRSTSDWRRFLDVLEEIGGSTTMTERFRTWVVRPTDHDELDRRLEARAALDDLDAAGEGWAAPMYVLSAMSRWRFDEADLGMDIARQVLDARGELAAIEERLGVTSPDDLEARYEAIVDAPDAAAITDDLRARGAAAETLITTRDALAVQPSLLAEIGLIGQLPATGFDTGLAAYRTGDLEAVAAGAAASMAVLDGAEAMGRERVTIGVAIAIGVVLLLAIVIALLWRRRRRRRGQRLAAVGASSTLAATPVPGTVEATTTIDQPASPLESPPVVTPPPLAEPPPTVPASGADAD